MSAISSFFAALVKRERPFTTSLVEKEIWRFDHGR